MALIRCSVCGGMVSDKAARCPKCGSPDFREQVQELPQEPLAEEQENTTYEDNIASRDGKKRKIAIWVVVSLLAIVLIGCSLWFLIDNAGNKQKDKCSITTSAIENNSNENDKAKDTSEDESVEKNINISAGITFRTFTELETEGDAIIQLYLGKDKVVSKLKKLGFNLSKSKKERREMYYGGEYYNVSIDTYSKTINGNTTTVKLEEEYTEIHFPNMNDVEEFRESVAASGLKCHGDEFEDNAEIYWAGTNVIFKGTTVVLSYKWAP